MKKIMAIILVVCCLFSLTVPAFAATPDNILTYELSCDNGGTDKHNITVSNGDVITVAYTITASARSVTATTQDQIIYDHTFFELVTEGDKPCIYKEATYADAFTTSNPIETDGTHYIYFNSTSNVTFAANKATQIGTFKLKVVATTGSSTITNTNYFATDKTATLFGAAKQDLVVTIGGTSSLEKETTPSASFTATGDSTGTLSGIAAGMKYSTNGGTSWTDVPAGSTSVNLTDLSAGTIKVVKKGNGTTTTDSDAQSITVTKAETPTTVGKTDCTTASNNDGTLTGVTTAMEYKKSTDSTWTAITGTTVTGLANGTYDVRVKASGTVLASGAQTVTVAEYVPDALTGTASISGTAKYGETLAASLTGSNNTGNLSYQWKRDGVAINGATGSTYVTVADDIGKNITVTISSDDQTGSQTSSSVTIAKADGPAAPSCTFSFDGTNAGKLVGSTTAMEYSLNGGTTWNDCANNTALTVANITVDKDIEVRVKETATANSGSVQTIDITRAEKPTNIGSTDCTNKSNNNGTLTNVTTAMEYKKSDESTWDAITGTVVTDLDNGTYNVRIRATGTVMASDAQSVIIAAYDPGELDGTVSIAGTPEYGKTLSADTSALTGNTGTLQFQWNRGTGAISGATNSTYVATTADIGENITVTVTSSEQNGSVTSSPVTVEKATPDYEVPTGLTATFGQTLANVDIANGNGTGSGTWSWVNSNTSVGNISATAKNFKAKFAPTDQTNYKVVENIDVGVTVGKAAAQNIADQNVSLKYTVTDEQSVSLADLMPEDAGTLSYTKGSESKEGTVTVSAWAVSDEGVLTYTLTAGEAGAKVTLPVTISSTNYADSTVNVVITLTDNKEPTVTGTPTASVTYGDAVSDAAITLNGVTVKDGTATVAGTWAWKNTVTSYGDATAAGEVKTLKAVFTPTASETYKSVEVDVNVSVAQKEVTVTGVKAVDREYAANEKAVVLATGDAQLSGIVDGDSITLDATNAAAAMADDATGENKAVTVTGFELAGEKAGNYTLTQPTGITVRIYKTETAVVPVTGTDVTDKKVDVKISGTNAELIINSGDLAKLNEVMDENKKTEIITVDLTDAGLNGAEIKSVEIPADALEAIANAAADTVNNDVTGLEVKMTDGTAQFDAAALAKIKEQAGIDGVKLIVVYDEGKETLNDDQKAELENRLRNNTDTQQTVYEIHLETLNGTTICAEAAGGFGDGTATVTVRHRLPDNATNIKVFYLKANGDTENIDYTQEGNEVVFVVEHLSEYVISYKENNPGPGPGPSVDNNNVRIGTMDNGKVTATPTVAPKGRTITLTVTPNDGYQLTSLTVTDGSNKTVKLTDLGNGKYSFVMPDSDVRVNATFTKKSVVSDCPRDYTCPIDPFTDTVNDAWWHDGIHYCVERGLMQGYPGNLFGPNDHLSRAQIVTILWRMEGSPVTNYAMSFKDVKAGQWYTEAIRWAQSTGVVLGYSSEAFGPNDDITREQLAAILYRYANYKGIDVSARSDLAQFNDASKISGWALENVKWAVKVGMINGTSTTTIAPTDYTNRAQTAAMIQRFCENILGK